MVVEKVGDLFTARTDAVGHGVNCKGLMGAGIAKQFRARYPDMYEEYKMLCVEGLLRPGDIFPYADDEWVVINIASQEYPGPDAHIEYLLEGVERALLHCLNRDCESLAIPRIGCGIGGLKWENVQPALEHSASLVPDVRLEVWSL